MIKLTKEKHERLFSAFIALLPILSIYATPVPGINLAEALLVGCWGILILSHRGLRIQVKIQDKCFLLLQVWIVISFLLSSLAYGFDMSALIRLIRFSLYYFSSLFLGQAYFNHVAFVRTINYISVISLAYLIIQYVAYYVMGGRILLGMIPGLPVYLDEYVSQDYAARYSVFFRPTSLFLEPAHFSQFMFIPLVFSLWGKANLMFAAAITLGILLSTSGQGIVITVSLWAIFVLGKAKKKKFSKAQLLTAMAFFVIGACLISVIVQSSVFSQSVARLLQTGEQGAAYARLSGYFAAVDEMTLFSFFFGKGFGKVPQGSWMPGLAYLWYGSGTIGVAFLVIYIISIWKKGNSINRTMLIVFVMTLIQSSVFMNIMVIPYMRIMREKWEERDLRGKHSVSLRRL